MKFLNKSMARIISTTAFVLAMHAQLFGFYDDREAYSVSFSPVAFVTHTIDSFARRQKEAVTKNIEYAINTAITEQLMRPLIYAGTQLFHGVSASTGFALRHWYDFTEDHQQLAAAFPSGALTGVLGISSGIFAHHSSYLYAACLGAGAVASTAKMIFDYVNTPVIRADTESPTTSVECRFTERLIDQLNAPHTHLVPVLESICSVCLSGLDGEKQRDFVRHIAQKTCMPLFITDGQTVLKSPKTLDAILTRANLAASTNGNLCALVFIEQIDTLKDLDENAPIIKTLTNGIETAMGNSIVRLQVLTSDDNPIHDRPDWQGTLGTEDVMRATTQKTPHVLFIGGLSNETNLNHSLTERNFFRLQLELKTNAQNAIVAKMKDPSVLTFSTINDYRSGAYIGADISSFVHIYHQIRERKAKLLTSGYDITNIPGGYPKIIDAIVHDLQTSVSTKGKPSFRGLLLWGPPGCGKTYLARGLAGTLKAPCFTIPIANLMPSSHGSHSEIQNLEQYCELAQQEAIKTDNGLAIIFIDECDQLLKPTDQLDPAIKPVALTLRSLLSGAEDTRYDRVIIIAATNTSPDDLDQALMRTGRFDYQIHMNYPNEKQRREILRHYLHAISSDAEENVQSEDVLAAAAANTEGFSASDLAALVQHAHTVAKAASKPLNLTHLKEQYFLLKERVKTRQAAIKRSHTATASGSATAHTPISTLTKTLEKINATLSCALKSWHGPVKDGTLKAVGSRAQKIRRAKKFNVRDQSHSTSSFTNSAVHS